MTWSQAAFGYSAVVVPAAASICGGWLAGQRLRSVLNGAFIAGGVAFAALFVMALGAKFCFPMYPAVSIPEIAGVLLTSPCVVAGALAFRYLDGWNRVTAASRYVLPAVLLSVWLAGVALSYNWVTGPYRKALPWSAAEIQEYAWTDGFLPDFTYFMRARISENQFKEYVRKFGLKASGTKESSWQRDDRAPSWFIPTPGLHKVYKVQAGDWSMNAVYDNGSIYVMAMEQ